MDVRKSAFGSLGAVNFYVNNTVIQKTSRQLNNERLGELLLKSGLINESQLQKALKHQRRSGVRLGRILIRQNAVCRWKLKAKLAELWALRACAGVVTLIMSLVAICPETAHAEEPSRIVLAAATANAGAPTGVMHYKSLFGTSERKSSDTSAFTKWNQMLARYKRQIQSQGNAPQIISWEHKLGALQNANLHDKIEGVNKYINSVPYKSDMKVWQKSDYWATPVEFLASGGDCEDYAIAKYTSLRALGVPDSQMRIAIVQDKIKNIPHALLIVYTDDGAYVLDNQNKNMEEMSNVRRYAPIFSINQNSWWLHTS